MICNEILAGEPAFITDSNVKQRITQENKYLHYQHNINVGK